MNHLSQATNNLLMQMVMDLKNGYIRRCESLGMTPTEMQMLQSLTIEDLHYLGNSPVSVLTVHIHHSNLARILHQARLEQQRTQRIDRALMLGGSIEMMRYFFGLSSLEIAARRRIAGIEVRAGRGLVLTEAENRDLWQCWQAAAIAEADSAEGLDIMMDVAERNDVSLTSIWNAVREWQPEESAGTEPATLREWS
ncbi:DUF2857 domain-containing protein [Xenorhabdus bovienii]|uniref:DUF2857 domain-containing protein n=1 Tax=Xenorhabdus bovienii TaxID=40576 RepID=UPI00237CB559|nr:DUF2857 domain-containing protein [Xenorhabdus bovienii]MDE1486585.1 DUF2857 domain-containing protein [Xenorhabdus bovienii]MDE1496441.1 DUF2857 domain-containing protein [Xenorhabdus bovienii]MDE9447166.1 DUF2857 domain-containing protein [Xenorhabdus bovienii]MDE9474415.1 DUF2857 domain-containing protein [Xenorhabdus bovienii]MDE9477205.1 DUF2857 domain-containing protein [Xenorhabdus bovienii]